MMTSFSHVDMLTDLVGLQLQLHSVDDLVGFGSKYIDERDFIPFLIRPDRIVQGNVLFRLLQTAQMHQNLHFTV